MVDVNNYMLTTFDNPWNPHTHFKEWLGFDLSHGYDTNGLLARVAVESSELPETYATFVIQNAIDEIVREDPIGIYRKIAPNDVPRPIPIV